MKRILLSLLLVSCLLGNARAVDIGYGGSPMLNMMTTMFDFMEWFLGRRDPLLHSYSLPWRYGYPIASWYAPYNATANPNLYQEYWDNASNPWAGMQVLDGVWRAQSGEFWLVRGNRFVLYPGNGREYPGEFRREGNFLLARMPWGETEFEYRQMGEVLVLRDVEGRGMLLRRVERGDWRW